MPMSPLRLTVAALCAATLLAGCKNGQSNTTAPTPAPTTAATSAGAGEPSKDTVVATIGEQKVTLGEVDATIEPQLKQLDEEVTKQKFELRRRAIENFVVEKLLTDEAKKRGLSGPDELLQAEIEAKVKPPSDEEVKATYDEAAASLPPGSSLEQFRPQIVQFLEQRQKQTLATEYIDTLKKNSNVNVLFKAPRKTVDATGPSKGPQDAKITIVEFSDFECPYCSRALPAVEQVLKAYPDQVRLVFRHFPLSFHPNAQKAGEASMCAHDQGKFWEMHDVLFQNQQALDVPSLKGYAKNLGLDTAAFDSCLDSGKHANTIRSDMAAGEAAGVNGTPAFFVNGVPLSGAVPFEQFKAVIDEELAQQK